MPARALPHDGVWARLGVSPIHGIGVFAIRDIPAGTNVFGGDEAAIVWVDRADIDKASPAARQLYIDFTIQQGDRIGCPASFNQLTVGWYCNEPAAGDAPNMKATDDYDLVAARDIAEGEELTLRYTSFSPDPLISVSPQRMLGPMSVGISGPPDMDASLRWHDDLVEGDFDEPAKPSRRRRIRL